jgi:hypothetical protein
MKQPIDEFLRSKVRDRKKIARAVQTIDRLRRKPPAGWNSVDVLRKLREAR